MITYNYKREILVYLHMLGIISGKWMMEYSPMIFCSRKETPIKNGVQTQRHCSIYL